MQNYPVKTKLYKELAKDFSPQAAAMKMCQYMETLERRIYELESAKNSRAKAPEAPVKTKEE